MSMTTLLGLSFGVFPCLLFGFIMLLSLLICEYIEEYVAKHLCAWKNRRRRGLRSFYQDFRTRRNSNTVGTVQHFSSRSRSYSSHAWVGTGNEGPGGEIAIRPEGNELYSPTAPPNERPGAQVPVYIPYPAITAANDPPPSYEECIIPRARMNSNTNAHANPNRNASPELNRPLMKKSPSTDKEK